MNPIRIKNQEKVLRTLIQLSSNYPRRRICQPKNFEDNFCFVSAEALIDILVLLEKKGYIAVQYGDYPDCFNISALQILPEGLDYRPQKALRTKEVWVNRLWGFLTGVILTGMPQVIGFFMSHNSASDKLTTVLHRIQLCSPLQEIARIIGRLFP